MIPINKILSNIRCCLADYMKNKYRNHMIGGDPDTGKIVALDEALFLYDDQGNQIWVVKKLPQVNYQLM